MLVLLTLTSLTKPETIWIMKKNAEPQRRAQYHHGDLKAQLIEATRQLVEAKGPDHLSVSEACRIAGVSTAAPYKHFKDKDDLLRAVALGGMERQHDQMAAAIVPLPPRCLERFVALGRVYVGFAQKEPAVFRLMFALSDDHADDDALVKKGFDTFGIVKAEVADYRGSATIEEADDRRAFQLWSFVHGLSFLMIDGKMAKVNLPFDLDAMLLDISAKVMSDVKVAAPV